MSKFGYFISLKVEFNSASMAEAFIQNVVKLNGIPKTVVSGRDMILMSKFWQQFFKAMETSLVMSPSYHPQTHGQSEALNKCLEMYLHCFVSEHPKLLVQLLPWAQY